MPTSTPPARSAGRAPVPGAIPPPIRPGGDRATVSAPVGHSDGSGGGARSGDRTTYAGRRRFRWGRIVLVAGMSVLLLGSVAFAGGLMYYKKIDAGLSRSDPFSQITGNRPAKTVKGALNILMLGSDSRDPGSKAAPGEWRTDTMMLMHIPASHDKAQVISIPRDLYVFVPKSSGSPELGGYQTKINSAFAWGGLPLAVEAVEGFTKVRVDNVVLIDFGGFRQVTDAVGGVDLDIEEDVTSIHEPFRHFEKGISHLNGEQALDYCRQRYQFSDGDFARVRHQQQFLKALMDRAASTGTLANPVRLNAFLQSVTKALTVDKNFSIADMALQFRGIRSSDLTFLVSPNQGSEEIDGESVVVPDKVKGAALYRAVANDRVDDWMAVNASPAPGPASKPGG